MPSVRHFVALGVGAAVALSCMEPGASRDLPSTTQPQNYRAESQATNPEVILPQGRLVEVSQDSQETQSAVDEENLASSSAIRSDEAEPKEAEAARVIEEEVTSDQATGEIETQESKDDRAIDSDEAQSTEEPREVGEKLDGVNEVSVTSDEPGERDRRLGTTANRQSLAEASQSRTESTIVQSPAPETPQSPSGSPGTSAPEFLNPSANPLLFPTEAEEVQVRVTQPITLQQALELARRNNRDLAEARLTLERSQAQLQEALAAEFPSATLNADFTRSDSAQSQLSTQGQPLASGDTISTSYSGTLELSYDLITGGRRLAEIRAASEAVRFQQLDIERITEQLRLDTSNTYYDLQQADAQVEISQAAVTDSARSLRDAQLQEQAGLGTRFDVLQAQVQLANDNQDLISAISQQRIRRRQLTQLLSLAQPVEVSAADPIEVAGDWDLSLEQSIVLAYKNRAELEQTLANRNINEQQRRSALSAIKPQASVFASYELLGVLDDDFGPADGFTLGARLQWNFFDGGAARARARAEEADIALSENDFARQRNQVRFDVEQAFFDLSANEENIQTASFALEQAQESLRLARLRFQAGVGTQADVITQQTELTRARVNRLTAILDYNRALAALQRAISNLPDSNLSDSP